MIIGIDIRNIGKKRTGDEVVFFNLTKNLATIDHENEYRLFTDMTDAETLENITKDLELEDKKNFEIISLPTTNRFAWNFWTLPQYLRKNPTDVYLTQYITPWFVPGKIRIFTIIHDVSFKVYPQYIKKSDLFFLNFFIPISLRRADKIIGVSKFTQEEIKKYYKIPDQKLDYVHNAVSEDFLKQDISQEKIASVRKKYDLPEKYILYIGTLQPRKNLPILAEAVHEPPLRENEVKLVIAGGKGNNYDERIDETIKKYNLEKNVYMPGFIEEKDKAAIMAGAEIFCFPSLYEGFGIPILEAMSVDTPVIASKIPPHEEISGQAAFFFNPHVPGELSQRISEIIRNETLKSTLSARGKKQVENFSWEKSARKMLEIFEKTGKENT